MAPLRFYDGRRMGPYALALGTYWKSEYTVLRRTLSSRSCTHHTSSHTTTV